MEAETLDTFSNSVLEDSTRSWCFAVTNSGTFDASGPGDLRSWTTFDPLGPNDSYHPVRVNWGFQIYTLYPHHLIQYEVRDLTLQLGQWVNQEAWEPNTSDSI